MTDRTKQPPSYEYLLCRGAEKSVQEERRACCVRGALRAFGSSISRAPGIIP